MNRKHNGSAMRRRLDSSPRVALARLLAGAIVLILGGELAYADPVCVNPAVGVPFASGPPKWWDPTPAGSAAIYQRIDDPRWKTAASITHGGGATEHVSFRALHHTESGQRSLYLSWWVKVAAVNPASNQTLYLGVRPRIPTTSGLLVKVNLTALANADTTDRAVSVHSVNSTGNFGTPMNPTPAWTDTIRAWANRRSPVSGVKDEWAINVNVPLGEDLGSGITLGDDFNLWYEILQGTPGMPLVEYTWPRSGASVTEVAFTQTLPAPGMWSEFHVGSGAGDLLCATGGIALEVVDIGTNHANGPGWISKTLPNTFFAKPRNKTTAPIDIDKVHARFRLANWGTQPDPNDILGPNTNLWKDIRGLGDVTQPGPGTVASNGQWNITGTWTLNSAEQAEFDGVNRWDHQCMLVELSGPNLVFLNNSIHRNMNFVTASTFKESAQVSVIGLPPPSGGGLARDVFLYLQTFNMPERTGGKPDKPPTPSSGGSGQNDDPHVNLNREGGNFLAAAVGEGREVDERPDLEKMTDSKPTLVVHGFYDTGRKLTINGVTHPVLRPLTSYGYFVNHEGPLSGWSHGLTGSGTVLDKITSNFYKLSSVRDTATINTMIEAKEGEGGKGCFDWFNKLFVASVSGGIGALGFIVASTRRKQQKKTDEAR